jgi:23S rRNA pseudouridine1911/1915/1917 synthase
MEFPPILYEDDALVVIAKPAGIHSARLPDGKGGASIADLLVARYPAIGVVAEKSEDAGLIHRLDSGTSGILIAAKTATTWSALHEALRAGEITKRYLVVLEGELVGQHTIENFLGSPHRRGRKMRGYNYAAPRTLQARSSVHPLEFNPHHGVTLAMVEAPTARRHQVRAHTAALGHPLVGDALYGAKRRLEEVFGSLPDNYRDGFCLHATEVVVRHPIDGRTLTIVAPPPPFIGRIFSRCTDHRLCGAGALDG